MQVLRQDPRFAARQLWRAPGFALVALAILVPAADFSVLDATVIRPLPYSDPGRIVQLKTRAPEGYTQSALWPQCLDWQRGNTTLSALGGFDASSATLDPGSGATAALVRSVHGSNNFFDFFGVKPQPGRTFAPGGDQAGHNHVVALSYDLWRQSLGGRRDVAGSTINVDGFANTIVDVMPAGFRYPLDAADGLYQPFHPTAEQSVAPELQDLVGKVQRPLHNLFGAVTLLLPVACANFTGLLLRRAAGRQGQRALRAAIGSTLGHIARPLLIASLREE